MQEALLCPIQAFSYYEVVSLFTSGFYTSGSRGINRSTNNQPECVQRLVNISFKTNSKAKQL